MSADLEPVEEVDTDQDLELDALDEVTLQS